MASNDYMKAQSTGNSQSGSYNQTGYHSKQDGYNKGQFSGNSGCWLFSLVIVSSIIGGILAVIA